MTRESQAARGSVAVVRRPRFFWRESGLSRSPSENLTTRFDRLGKRRLGVLSLEPDLGEPSRGRGRGMRDRDEGSRRWGGDGRCRIPRCRTEECLDGGRGSKPGTQAGWSSRARKERKPGRWRFPIPPSSLFLFQALFGSTHQSPAVSFIWAGRLACRWPRV